MKLKNVIILLIAGLVLVGCDKKQRDSLIISLKSQSYSRDKLMEAVEQVNASCPMETGEHNVLLGASFENDRWTYKYSIEEDTVVTFDNKIQSDKVREKMKESTRTQILSSPSMLTMLEALVKVNADLVYEFKGSESGTKVEVVFTVQELKVMKDCIKD